MLLRQCKLTISVEELIRYGRLPINNPFTAAALADLVRMHNVPQRRNRRLGVLGNISGLSGTSTQVIRKWTAQRSTGLPAPITVSNPVNTDGTKDRAEKSYEFGTGAGQINQIAQSTITVTNGTPNNFAVDVWALNVIGDASATFSKIRELWVELLTIAQGGGATSSGITLGGHATDAWAAILDAAGLYTLGTGGLWHHQDQSTAGLAVATGDILKIINNDAGNIASIRLTAFGLK